MAKAKKICSRVFTTKTGKQIVYEFGFNGKHHYMLRNGEDYAGLWFEGNKLVDYDGCFELTKNCITTIRGCGYKVPSEFEAEQA
jgi:hypothetical protein